MVILVTGSPLLFAGLQTRWVLAIIPTMKPLLIAMLSVLVLQQSFAGNLGPDQQKQIRRSFISVKFIGVNATESITVEVTNNTGKDIRDIRGGYIFEDTDLTCPHS